MLEIMHTNESNVGIFAAILTITSIIWLIRAGALYIYNPMIAPLFEKKQFDELQKIARQSAKNITYISLIIFILLIIFSKEILSLYGKSFEGASLELIIIALGFFIKSLSALSESLLKFSGHVIHSIKPQIYCFIMNIILCAVLIPYFGLLGAAISLLISRSLLSIWQARIVKKILNIQTFIFYI
jgi:O-antigen/teichoic acid export membrane protein